MVILPSYKETGPSFSDGLLAVEDNKNRWGFINSRGQAVVPLIYKSVVPIFTEGFSAVQDENKLWGFINEKVEITASPRFKALFTPFSEGLIGVKTADGSGYVKPDGTIAFMADYEKLYPFEGGIAEVRNGEVGETAVMRRFPISIGIGWGNWFHHHPHHGWGWGIGIPLWDPWYYDYDTVPSIQVKRGYIDKQGRVIASPSNDRVFKAGEKGILIRNKGMYGWVNRSGQFVAHTLYRSLIPYEEEGVLLAQQEDKKWGIISMDDGSILADFDNDGFSYVQKGIFGYKVKDRWGLITGEGKKISQPVYKAVSKGGEGLIPVKTKNGWQYVSCDGNDEITFKEEVDDVTPFCQGLAGVKVQGKWGLIDRSGHFVEKPSYDELDIL